MTRRLSSASGMTLIETVIACSILVTVMLGLASAIAVSTRFTENEGHLAARTAEYAQDKMEQLLALAYSDAGSNTTQVPTASTGGTGLAVGGSSDPAAPAASYIDWLDDSGNLLCPCTGTTAPAGWFYERVWQITNPSTNLKQITVTATVKQGSSGSLAPKTTVSALRARVGLE
jgi:hypothetical protein